MQPEFEIRMRRGSFGALIGASGGNEVELVQRCLSDHHIVGFSSFDKRVQPFIALRSMMMQHIRESGHRVFAITSVQPGNGKTHVAVNLAAVLSRIVPTRLIELDLRRPMIGARLGLRSPFTGIDDVLAGKAQLADSATRIRGYDLTIHRVRRPRADAGTLLASLQTQRLFEALRELPGAPVCIVDTPPVFVDDDFMLVAPGLDGAMVVVEEGRTTKHALRETMDALRPTEVLGAVLNKSCSSSAPNIDYGGYCDVTPRPPRMPGRARSVWGRIRQLPSRFTEPSG